MTDKQWRKLFSEALNDILSSNPTGDALNDLWVAAEAADPHQENFPLRTAMYLLFAYEKTPALHQLDLPFFGDAMFHLFPGDV